MNDDSGSAPRSSTPTRDGITAQDQSRARLLTIEQAAARLNVSVRNIRHQIYTRRLAVVKIGRLVRIDERDLEALIARGRVPPA